MSPDGGHALSLRRSLVVDLEVMFAVGGACVRQRQSVMEGFCKRLIPLIQTIEYVISSQRMTGVRTDLRNSSMRKSLFTVFIQRTKNHKGFNDSLHDTPHPFCYNLGLPLKTPQSHCWLPAVPG